jgi:hypothetical protein
MRSAAELDIIDGSWGCPLVYWIVSMDRQIKQYTNGRPQEYITRDYIKRKIDLV